MRNKLIKFISIVSTLLLTIVSLVTSVSAVTVSSALPSSSRQSTAVQRTSTVSSSYSSVTVSNSSKSILSASGSSKLISKTSSSLNGNPKPAQFAATVDDNSNTEGWEGQNHVVMTAHYVPGEDSESGIAIGQGIYPHFTVNDDIGKCYCYDWEMDAPDKPTPGLTYNRYDFWDGMKAATNKQKEDQVAAAMMAGYHLNRDDNKWEVSPAFQQAAEDGYKEAISDYESGNYDPDDSSEGSAEVAANMGPNYSLQDYEQDVTQSVIWKLSGATNSEADLANKTKFGRMLYNYAIHHPMNEETAKADNVKITSNGEKVSQNNPLTIDPITLKSQAFTFNGYNGNVNLLNKNPNIEVIDSQTNQPVTELVQGRSYYLQAKSEAAANSNSSLSLQFQKIDDSHYFSVVDADAKSWNANNKYQNMVNLATKALTLPINYVFAQKQSSSSLSTASSTSSKKSSSNVKGSSVVSSSSVKSSSVVSSSKKSSSSVKSSSVVLSNNKKSSSSKSSSVVSSSKKSSSSVKSSSVVLSSNKKSSSSVKSSSVVSSSSKKSSSVVSSSKKSSSSVKNSSIVLSSNKKSSSSVKSSSVVSSSNKKSSSSVKSSSVESSSNKKSSSSVKSSSVESSSSSKKSSSSVKSSSVVSSSKSSSKVASSSEVASSKKAVVTGVRHNSESGKGSGYGEGHGQGKGYGHGIPQTGEAAAASLVVVGVVLLATAGAITLRKRN